MNFYLAIKMFTLPPISKKSPSDVVRDIRERYNWTSWACFKEYCRVDI